MNQLDKHAQIKICFVCMGNICRSPTAHGVFRKLVREAGLEASIEIDSAGTHSYHVGEAPDPRAQQAALGRGVDISDLRARKATPGDFQRFDLVLAMDGDNHHLLSRICAPEQRQRLRMFLDFAPDATTRDVPDPYYGGGRGFERVLDLVEEASRGLLDHSRLQLKGY